MEYKLFSYVNMSFESGTIMFIFCWCFFLLRVSDENDQRKRNFLKTLQSRHFWRRQFPVLIGSRCKRMCSKPCWRHIIWKIVSLIAFLRLFSITSFFENGIHTFSNENHRGTWGRGLNHDSPVCVCMSFRSDLVSKNIKQPKLNKVVIFLFIKRAEYYVVFDMKYDLLCQFDCGVRKIEISSFVSVRRDLAWANTVKIALARKTTLVANNWSK